jgi:bifunctional non-homologous end joining protein LigD
MRQIVQHSPVKLARPTRDVPGKCLNRCRVFAWYGACGGRVMPQLRTDSTPAPPPAARVAGVAISNPERAVAAAPGWTKLDVARYHERVAAWLLPQLAPRPIAVVRCPGSRIDDCFFQKHPAREREADGDDSSPFMRLAETADVVRAVQNGAFEFHTWGASFPRLERPDRITLDLDPDAALTWPTVREAAERVRGILDRLGLRWFVKTTGGKGLHFVLPITRRHTWAEARTFARAIAETLAAERPALFTATAAKEARAGRVYVDYLRNAQGATTVAAYSLRARPGLPVSMPIEWSDLASDVRGGHFSIENAATFLARRRVDPWADYERSRQTLSATLRRAVGA